MIFQIDQKRIKAKEGQTVLEAARLAGMDLPALCYHPDLEIKGNCRMCLVEIEGRLLPACATKVKEGMKVSARSPRVKRAREINLGLIFNGQPELKEFAEKHKIKMKKFPARKKDYPDFNFGPAVKFDLSKCINCRSCLEACQKQQVGFYQLKEKDNFKEVATTDDPCKDCIFCGQCVIHCPVGALKTVSEKEEVKKALKDKKKKVVVQFAPSIRTTISEAFGMPRKKATAEKLASSLKKLGFDWVFDTCTGADFTTYEESKEILAKVQKCQGVCLSSCCPAWVKFVEFYHPEFVGNIASTRSPQTILGGLIKTYFAKKQKIDPKNIVVVSIMPCTAKKYEKDRRELDVKGLKPVDCVLTTAELAELLKEKKIDLKSIKPQKADNPLGVHSGAAVIYGATGGVAESVLRTAYHLGTKKKIKKINFKSLRGMQGAKKAEIEINGKKLKLAVVNGLDNAEKILKELKENPKAYDAVEVMACPGGCIGGGGQLLPTDSAIRKERAESLYDIDESKKLRTAHENPVLKKVYEEFLDSEEKIRAICHTNYSPKKKREVI